MIENFHAEFPQVPKIIRSEYGVYGWWGLRPQAHRGNNGRLHGSYPVQYVKRIMSLFPDATNVLHVPSGSLDAKLLGEGHVTMDMMQDAVRKPMIVGDACEHIPLEDESFDLVMSDPPYTQVDSQKYGCPPWKPMSFFREANRVLRPGGYLVYLHQRMPQLLRRDQGNWKFEGVIFITLGSNKLVRVVCFYQKVTPKQFKLF